MQADLGDLPAFLAVARAGGFRDGARQACVSASGIITLFESWLRPYLDRGALEPVLEPWWPSFSGPFLY